MPNCCAAKPQIHDPIAMPPNTAVWYSDSARPTTQRGVDICTMTLNSDSVITHDAPASASAGPLSQRLGLKASQTSASAKTPKPSRARCSPSIIARSRAFRKPPRIAPMPKQPSIRPKLAAPSCSRSRATTGNSAMSAIAPNPYMKARNMTRSKFGDIAT